MLPNDMLGLEPSSADSSVHSSAHGGSAHGGAYYGGSYHGGSAHGGSAHGGSESMGLDRQLTPLRSAPLPPDVSEFARKSINASLTLQPSPANPFLRVGTIISREKDEGVTDLDEVQQCEQEESYEVLLAEDFDKIGLEYEKCVAILLSGILLASVLFFFDYLDYFSDHIVLPIIFTPILVVLLTDMVILLPLILIRLRTPRCKRLVNIVEFALADAFAAVLGISLFMEYNHRGALVLAFIAVFILLIVFLVFPIEFKDKWSANFKTYYYICWGMVFCSLTMLCAKIASASVSKELSYLDCLLPLMVELFVYTYKQGVFIVTLAAGKYNSVTLQSARVQAYIATFCQILLLWSFLLMLGLALDEGGFYRWLPFVLFWLLFVASYHCYVSVGHLKECHASVYGGLINRIRGDGTLANHEALIVDDNNCNVQVVMDS